MPKISARDKLRAYFLNNVGKVLSTHELAQVAGISEYARRIRELRNHEGWEILTHHDRADLKVGEYILVSETPQPSFGKGISATQRAKILARNGYTCQACGAGAGEPHPIKKEHRTRLQVDHIVPVSQGGNNKDDNLRVLCSVCNEGRSNLDIPTSEKTINALAMIRRAPRDVQKEIYEFLKRKYE